jgi:hypothetical protein
MSNKGKYKIPKSHALWPILWRTVVFLGIIAMIFAVLNILAGYVRDFRSEADTTYVRNLADIIDQGTEAEREEALNALSSDGHNYCIIDLYGEVVEHSGSISVSGYNDKKGEFYSGDLKDILDEAGVDDDIHKIVLDAGSNSTFLLDDYNTKIDAFSEVYDMARNNPGVLFGSSSDAVFSFPYWIAAPMSESSQILMVKSILTVKVKDYTYLAAGIIIAVIIAFFVFILMIVSVIMNLSANSKLRRWLYRDNIIKGHNWLWYAVTT